MIYRLTLQFEVYRCNRLLGTFSLNVDEWNFEFLSIQFFRKSLIRNEHLGTASLIGIVHTPRLD